MTRAERESRTDDTAQDPQILAFVDELAALYAVLWHEGKLDAMVDPDAPSEDE